MNSYIMRNLELYYPFLIRDAVEYRQDSEDCVLITLKNGDKVLYDDYYKTFRVLPRDSNALTEQECRREFSNKLHKLLMYNHMTQDELAEATQIHKVTISRYMNGKSTPSFYHVDRIAKVLGCSMDELRYI